MWLGVVRAAGVLAKQVGNRVADGFQTNTRVWGRPTTMRQLSGLGFLQKSQSTGRY